MKEEIKHINLVIVGHIDHGKSTLIGRLFYDTNSLPEGVVEELKKTCESLGKQLEFAFIMDALQEEREQGITIDTTQSFFKTDKREYVIIDAPGHREFIKNMITGASQADAAILIIDASKGIREQTKRHAYILSLLRIKQIIVAINKMDIVDWDRKRFEKLKTEVKEMLKKLNLDAKFIIPISAKFGDNIAKKSDKLDSITILEALDELEDNEINEGKLRFPIQDVYRLDGRQILSGRIESGRLRVGEEIVFMPLNKKARIKSIESWPENMEEARQDMSIGIVLYKQLLIKRGEVACKAEDETKSANRFKTSIFWILNPELKNLDMKLATQETPCRIERIDNVIDSSSLQEKKTKDIKMNDVIRAEIITKKPIIADEFEEIRSMGRFVLENKNGEIVAAGIIEKII